MRNLKILFALLIFTVAFSSCDSTVTIDDPQNGTTDEITTKTGDEGNDGDERGS